MRVPHVLWDCSLQHESPDLGYQHQVQKAGGGSEQTQCLIPAQAWDWAWFVVRDCVGVVGDRVGMMMITVVLLSIMVVFVVFVFIVFVFILSVVLSAVTRGSRD